MNLFGHLVGLLGWGSAHCKAATYTGQHNTEKCEHTSMPRAGFKSMIPVFKQLKTVHALDCVAIGTGLLVPKILFI